MTELKKRCEVPIRETWDLTMLYKNDDDWNAELESVCESAEKFEREYKGNLKESDRIVAMLADFNELLIRSSKAAQYAGLAYSADMTDESNQKRYQRAEIAFEKIQKNISFIKPELLGADDELLKRISGEHPEFKVYLESVRISKPHTLSYETEHALSALEGALNLPYSGYEITKMADMKFGTFEANGKEHELSFVKFENEYEYVKNTELRRNAFKEFSKVLKSYENTIGNYYITQVRKEKSMSELRGYESVFDYLLEDQYVSREMYDRQIDVITEKLSPVMRKYAALLKRVHKLDEIRFEDLKVPLDPDFSPQVSIDESKEYVKGALSVMGDEYLNMLMKSYDERWVDFAQNEGKSTGGFCASPYGEHSYILLSWTGMLSEVFTLVHELGHAGHFMNAAKGQSFLNYELSGYLVEAPSTMNELLLGKYLFEKSDDLRFKRWVNASLIGNTYYHNMVTHLLEAAYQREVYRRVDRHEPISVKDLSDIKRKVLEDFWKDDVVISEGAELTWMRQPHYFMGLYSYTYSAGLTISTAVARRINELGKVAVEDWLSVLRAGGTLKPMEFAAKAGVDISTDKALKDTIEYIDSLVDEMVTITDELEAKK